MKDYNKGDTVWYVAKHYDNRIAIKCEIKDVDDHFRKQDENAYLFYHLDIVVGHAVAADELCENRQQVEECFDELLKDREKINTEITFEEWHNSTKEFVKSTWEESGEEHPGFDEFEDDGSREWFTLKQYRQEQQQCL